MCLFSKISRPFTMVLVLIWTWFSLWLFFLRLRRGEYLFYFVFFFNFIFRQLWVVGTLWSCLIFPYSRGIESVIFSLKYFKILPFICMSFPYVELICLSRKGSKFIFFLDIHCCRITSCFRVFVWVPPGPRFLMTLWSCTKSPFRHKSISRLSDTEVNGLFLCQKYGISVFIVYKKF